MGGAEAKRDRKIEGREDVESGAAWGGRGSHRGLTERATDPPFLLASSGVVFSLPAAPQAFWCVRHTHMGSHILSFYSIVWK